MNDFQDDYLPDAPPISEQVVLIRDKSGLQTNVPHLIAHHSPDGFEWGYGGSGPADLSLNILHTLLRLVAHDGAKTALLHDNSKAYQLAWDLHQNFKGYVIVPLPRSHAEIRLNSAVITTWLLGQLELKHWRETRLDAAHEKYEERHRKMDQTLTNTTAMLKVNPDDFSLRGQVDDARRKSVDVHADYETETARLNQDFAERRLDLLTDLRQNVIDSIEVHIPEREAK
jgi:hypothetical protein